MFENEEAMERALLVSLDTGEYDAEASLAELGELTESAGADPAFTLMQKRPAPDSATCIGSGMAQEAAELIEREKLDLCIFDRELSPTQIRNLEELFGVRVIDRQEAVRVSSKLSLPSFDICCQGSRAEVLPSQGWAEALVPEALVKPSLKPTEGIYGAG